MTFLAPEMFVVIPVVGAMVLPLAGRLNRVLAEVLAFVVAETLFVMSVAVVWVGPETWSLLSGRSVPGLGMAGDGLSLPAVVMISAVFLLLVVFSVEITRSECWGVRYYALLLSAAAGLNGVVLAGDMLTMFVFLETAYLSFAALVALGRRSTGSEAAFKGLVLSGIASALFLVVLGLLYRYCGGTGYEEVCAWALADKTSLQAAFAAALTLAVISFKCGLAPFHTHLLDLLSAGRARVSAAVAGAALPAVGIYLMIRLFIDVFPLAAVGNALVFLGLGTCLVAGLFGVVQKDYLRALGHGILVQMGFAAVGTGVLVLMLGGGATPDDCSILAGGVLLSMISTGLMFTLLFMTAADVERASGTTALGETGGIAARLPSTGLGIGAGLLSLAGMPPFIGFWSRLMLISGCFVCGRTYTALAVTALSLLPLLLAGRLLKTLVRGNTTPAIAKASATPAGMWVPVVLLAVSVLLTGLVWTLLFETLVGPAVSVVLPPRP